MLLGRSYYKPDKNRQSKNKETSMNTSSDTMISTTPRKIKIFITYVLSK